MRAAYLLKQVAIYMSVMACFFLFNSWGTVVQSTIRGNAGLNFDLLFLFMHFCRRVLFKTIKKKSSSDTKNICWKTC